MEGADKRFAEDRLIVLQSGVGDHVHELGHERAPQLDQGVLGGVRTRITALEGRYEPTEAQTGYALAQWIRDVRSKSIDPIVIRQNWLRAYDLLTPKASAFLNDRAQANDPFAEAGREAVNVEVLNVVRRSDRTFDLQWRETRFVNGQQAGSERWRALITTGLQPPRTEAELMKNPLGLKIEDVSWTPDAS